MKQRLVIIDDDPTGCQTVAGVALLMEWGVEMLRLVLVKHEVFFILTNSRAMTATEAEKVSMEVGRNLKTASGTEYQLTIVSRCDSTLRGHLWEEILPLNEIWGGFDAFVFCPAFFEGGRYTFGNIHYLRQNDGLIPIARTEFAKDPMFGYAESDLTKWLGRNDVASIPLDAGLEKIVEILMAVEGFCPVVVNAVNYVDLEVLCRAVKLVRQRGKKLLFRSAASLVRVLAGQEKSEPFVPTKSKKNGLVVVGSYTSKTTLQLNKLLVQTDISAVEVDVDKLLNVGQPYFDEVSDRVLARLQEGRNVCIYTSRTYTLGGDNEGKVEISKRIAAFLDELVKKVKLLAGFIIAKGGITSYSIAKNGLGIRSTMVAGQIIDGVPVWTAHCPYIVFPGNVGDTNALYEVYEKLA